MKAIEILDCIMYMGLSGEDLTKIEVPSINDEYTPQDEEWWNNQCGGVPEEEMIDDGIYLAFYPNDARDLLQKTEKEFVPDATIRINGGEAIVYLYKVED